MNLLLDTKLGDPTGSEPVTLQEAKDHIKQSSSADDTLITLLISAARDQIEKYTGVSLVERQVDVIAKIDGFTIFELPYGPIQSEVVVTLLKCAAGGTDTVLTEDQYLVRGNQFQSLEAYEGTYALTYDTGWTTVPEALKLAILNQVAFLYEHRGDEWENRELSLNARILAKGYRRCVC